MIFDEVIVNMGLFLSSLAIIGSVLNIPLLILALISFVGILANGLIFGLKR